MYSEQKRNKNNDDNWPISVQHSVNRVAQNRAELYSEIESRDCFTVARLAMAHLQFYRATKVERENCRCDRITTLKTALA